MPFGSDIRQIHLYCVRQLLKPVARFCIRRGCGYQDCSSVLKEAFVDVAAEEIKRESGKVNVSRISALTGLIRKDVNKIYNLGESAPTGPLSIPARVVGLWENERKYRGKNKKPKALTYHEFQELVAAVSQHIHAGTVLFELTRYGHIVKKGELIYLRKRVYNLAADPRKGMELVAQDIDSLIECSEENLLTAADVGNLHIRTEYDNLSEKSLRLIRRWFITQGKALHRRARKFLSQHDLDVSPTREKREKGGKRAVITTFAVTSPLRVSEPRK